MHDLKDREEPQSPKQRLISRVLMLCGAGLTVLAAALTSGTVRIVAVGLTAGVAVAVWAYYDYRTERRVPRSDEAAPGRTRTGKP
ncbi:hypothetical protein [Streptomyces sviceus]|uniref:hypothetical protein n=1 Tax=Streptomyces sviceus TaxID=285530 RepID=UPI0033322F45